jgi:hypothetical protein
MSVKTSQIMNISENECNTVIVCKEIFCIKGSQLCEGSQYDLKCWHNHHLVISDITEEIWRVSTFTEMNITDICKIWGFHGGDYEERCLLGCYIAKAFLESGFSDERDIGRLEILPVDRFFYKTLNQEMANIYNNSGQYSSCRLFKTRRFRGWILCPSLGGTYSGGPNRKS